MFNMYETEPDPAPEHKQVDKQVKTYDKANLEATEAGFAHNVDCLKPWKSSLVASLSDYNVPISSCFESYPVQKDSKLHMAFCVK